MPPLPVHPSSKRLRLRGKQPPSDFYRNAYIKAEMFHILFQHHELTVIICHCMGMQASTRSLACLSASCSRSVQAVMQELLRLCGPHFVVAGGDRTVGGDYSEDTDDSDALPDGPFASSVIDCFDICAGVHKEFPAMPTPRVGCAVVAGCGHVYVIGGQTGRVQDAEPDLRTAVRLEMSSMTWTSLPKLSESRSFSAACMLKGQVIVASGLIDVTGLGWDGYRNVSATEVYKPGARSWKVLSAMKQPRGYAACATFDGAMYVFGGEADCMGVLRSAEKFDPAKNEWFILPQMPIARTGSTATVAGQRIIIVGGFSAGRRGRPLSSIDIFMPVEGKWSTERLPSMPRPRNLCIAAAVNGRLYVFGGAGKFSEGTKGATVDVLRLHNAPWGRLNSSNRDVGARLSEKWTTLPGLPGWPARPGTAVLYT